MKFQQLCCHWMYLAFLSPVLLVAPQNRTTAITASHHDNGINQFSTQPLLTIPLSSFTLVQRSINFSLLVGEWSERGKCNALRYIFMRNGRYQRLERKHGEWKTVFDGIYVPRGPDEVNFGETNETGEDNLKISKLTQTTLIGRWTIGYDYKISSFWTRCPNR
jgi:hypothetical protein